MDCDNAFVNFFKSNNGTRKGNSGFPKFKSKKDNHQSYREPNINGNCKIFFENRLVKIPKVGKVAFKDRAFPKWWSQIEKLCSMTISKSCSGNYYVSILFEISPYTYKVENRKEAIGLDFSPSEMYVSSENQTGKDFGYVAQKQAHSKKLRRLQRQFARKQMVAVENCPRKVSSKNREKARIKLAKLEEHIANSRKDWIEKETLRLVKSYNKVVVEGVAMVKKHQKARTQNAPAGIVEREGSIDASNVMVVCPTCGKATRVKHAEVDGKKVRVCKCGAVLDKAYAKKAAKAVAATEEAPKKRTRKRAPKAEAAVETTENN